MQKGRKPKGLVGSRGEILGLRESACGECAQFQAGGSRGSARGGSRMIARSASDGARGRGEMVSREGSRENKGEGGKARS